jgi:2-keto-3-deoxy-L-rhamnonate aldolase RhmA
MRRESEDRLPSAEWKIGSEKKTSTGKAQKKHSHAMIPTFIDKIRRGQKQIGTIVTLPCPELASGLFLCGFDWLWIDMEHAPLSLRSVQDLLHVDSGGAARMVRVPTNDPVWIKQVLDLGCDGIIIPFVQSAAEAERAVEAAKYPPQGTRSVGITRAHMFGLEFASYVEKANAQTTVLLQVEHIQAVKNIDQIIAVPGVDGILAGPYDLSGSMNLLGQTSHKRVLAALDELKAACAKCSMPVGSFTLNPADANRLLKDGYDFLALGIDTHYLISAARKALAEARG